MKKAKRLTGLLFCAPLFSASVIACELSAPDSLLLSEVPESGCQTSELLPDSEPVAIKIVSEEEVPDDNYWGGFAFTQDTDPIVTTQVDNSFFGLGVWLPEDLQDLTSEMKADEWLLNHGVQLSLGIGSQRGKEPRMRVDYRWHQDFAPDVMFQLELPF